MLSSTRLGEQGMMRKEDLQCREYLLFEDGEVHVKVIHSGIICSTIFMKLL